MMQPSGMRNLLGYGQATPGEDNDWYAESLRQLENKKQNDIRNKRYDQAKKEQDDKELYGLVGDALNLKDFNSVIHDDVKKAQVELAQKIKKDKPSYADTYLMAQNKAAELGRTSTDLNAADKIITAQKKEWEGDKRINAANLEALARKDILDDLKKNGKIDPNVNYINRALRKYPEYALTDNGEMARFNFLPEELQKDLKGGYKSINKRGGYDDFDWNIKEYAPAIYEFKDNGQDKAPTLTTKSEPSGLVDADKNPVPMLSEDAWGRYGAVTSNITDLDRRLKKRYGNSLDLESPEAETLRRVEAYKEAEKNKPRVNATRNVKADPVKNVTNINLNSDKNAAKAEANNWLTNTDAAVKAKDINTINGQFQILERGGRFVNVSAKYNKDGNVEVEYSSPQPDGDLKTFYRTFKNDANLTNQLKGIYQSMTGEDKVFEYSKPDANKPTGKNMDAYKSDKTETNWKNNGNGTFTYIPTGQKIDSKTGKVIQ